MTSWSFIQHLKVVTCSVVATWLITAYIIVFVVIAVINSYVIQKPFVAIWKHWFTTASREFGCSSKINFKNLYTCNIQLVLWIYDEQWVETTHQKINTKRESHKMTSDLKHILFTAIRIKGKQFKYLDQSSHFFNEIYPAILPNHYSQKISLYC